MPRVTANGVELYYEESGEGAPILCIHGTSSSALVWRAAASEVARHGRCIMYDRRGCYRSERPEPYVTTDVAGQADDAAALLDALGATPAVVIGRSYGGQVALDLARRYPAKARAMALLEPSLFALDPEAGAWADAERRKVLEAGERVPDSVAEVFIGIVAGHDARGTFPEDVKRMFVGNGPAIMAELRGRPLALTEDQLAEVDQRTLIVSSAGSPEAHRRVDGRLAGVLPHAERAFVEGGHLIDPADRAVMDFVDRVVAAPQGRG